MFQQPDDSDAIVPQDSCTSPQEVSLPRDEKEQPKKKKRKLNENSTTIKETTDVDTTHPQTSEEDLLLFEAHALDLPTFITNCSQCGAQQSLLNPEHEQAA